MPLDLMIPLRKMKQIVLLISLIIALWLGAIVILKKLPDNGGMDIDYTFSYIPNFLEGINFDSTNATFPTSTTTNAYDLTSNYTTTHANATFNTTTASTTPMVTTKKTPNITTTVIDNTTISNVPDIMQIPVKEENETHPSLEFLEEQQASRKKYLKEVCKMLKEPPLNLNQREVLDHLVVDDMHKLLYCYVPKVACTNWKRVLMVLMGKSNKTDPLDIVADASHRGNVFQRLSDFRPDEITYRLKHYTKFMFVRQPFERLLSAYRNKFSTNASLSDYFRVRFGKQIIKLYRRNATQEALSQGHDVTFEEFTRYIIDPRTVAQSPYNEHWRPMSELCLPCQIDYDIIGKYETLKDDAWFVLEKAHLSQKVQFPHTDRPSRTGSLVDQFFGQLTEEQRLRLYHVYELDFRLFDYQTPPFS